MNPWRLEWLRLTRSPRGPVLLVVYLFFGFTGPLLVRYLDRLAKLGSSGMRIIAPPPKPADGLVNYVSQSNQTGLLVHIVVVAGALSYDAHRGLATFYRTRAPGPFALIWPRFVPWRPSAPRSWYRWSSSLAGAVKVVARWLPTSLMRAPAGPVTGTYGPGTAKRRRPEYSPIGDLRPLRRRPTGAVLETRTETQRR
jgi:hypothetical protein